MKRLQIALSAAACGALVASCKTPTSDARAHASTASAALVGSPPVAAAAPRKPWFSGGFSGQYEAKVAVVEVKVGAVKEWSKDDGKLASGPGKLSLQIDDAGQVDGTSE